MVYFGGDQNRQAKTMIDIAFRYDHSEKKWVQCEDESLIRPDIEKVPFVLIVEYTDKRSYVQKPEDSEKEQFVFCPRHRRLEKIPQAGEVYIDSNCGPQDQSKLRLLRLSKEPDAGEIVSVFGCRFSNRSELFAFAQLPESYWWASEPFVYVPFRWRIFQRDPGQPLSIAGDVAKVQQTVGESLSIRWVNVAYSVHIASKKLVVTQSKILKGWAKNKNDIPDEVVKAAMELLRTDTELDSGLKPSDLSQMKGHGKIESFVERPFDLNIVYLKTFFREFAHGDFEQLFPYEEKDNYRKICELLEIQPPQSLRKAYTFNPYAIVWYMILTQLGITDINLIRPFFDLKEHILHIPLKDLYFSPSDRQVKITKESGSERDSERLDWAVFYARWLLEQGGEKKFLRWLRDTSSQKEPKPWQWDVLRILQQYHGHLSEAIKQRLFKDGITRYVHNIISWEATVLTSRWKNVGIQYPESILAYECRINDYEFHIVRETLHLTHLGHMMKNCVATYRKAVLDRRSIIVAVQHENKYVACIELQNNNFIVQALGVCDHYLKGDDLLVCRFWAKRNALVVKTAGQQLALPKSQDGTPLLQDLSETEVILEPCREIPPRLPETAVAAAEAEPPGNAADNEPPEG